jgi:hypothetical protein
LVFAGPLTLIRGAGKDTRNEENRPGPVISMRDVETVSAARNDEIEWHDALFKWVLRQSRVLPQCPLVPVNIHRH